MPTFNGTTATGGAITKSEVFIDVTAGLAELAGQVKNIDRELRKTLYDLAGRDDFLDDTDSVTTEDGTAGYTEPVLIKKIKAVHIAGGQDLVEGSYDEYLRDIEDQSSPTTGEPEKWCRWNGEIILYHPIPGDEYTVTVDYYKYHANSVTTIEFAEMFREALTQGILYRLYTGQLKKTEDAGQQAITHKQLYENEIQILTGNRPSEPMRVRYRDI